jgi:hypothetical protein
MFSVFVFLLPYTYGGCVFIFSSGGSDKDEEKIGDTSSGGFIGITSQAEISSENAEELTAGAFAGGLTNVELQSHELNQSSYNFKIGAFRPLRFPVVLRNSLRKVKLDPTLITFNPTNIMTEDGDFEGRCGGDFSYSLNYNRVSKRFSGTLSFKDYCDDGITIAGETTVDGDFKVVSGDFTTVNFSFDNLTDGHLSMEGQISIDLSDSPILATFAAYGTDKYTGRVYWIKNYGINLFEWVDHLEIEVFGTFYHPDYGFVILTTSAPFVVHNGDDWPTAGQILIQGDKNTTAQFTVINQLGFGVEADTNGDGTFNWDSGILNWEDF